MNGSLQEAIDAANAKAGRSRQKVFAKKAYLRQTDAQVIDMLCQRAQELLAAVVGIHELKVEKAALAEAVKIAEKHREGRR